MYMTKETIAANNIKHQTLNKERKDNVDFGFDSQIIA